MEKKVKAKKVRTRFAPSPTGFLHIGSLRTALYAYVLAKHEGGDFLLRIEDTDQKREVEGATEALQTTLKKFGLNWDEFYVQSERAKDGLYTKYARKLVDEGHAFYCQCDPKNAKTEGYSKKLRDPCRNKDLKNGAIKLRVPDGRTVSFYDFVHKKDITWNTNEVYDATLLKSDGFPTYHLAAMVDDIEMEVSHIIRGHDWLPSTPIHLLVFEFLGKKRPEIGHPTDILSAETGKKLSKRRDSVFVEQFLKDGYLPEALLNFVMLLGWAPKDNRELYSLEELVDNFDIKGFQHANPRFLITKLNWINSQHIKKLDDSTLINQIDEFYGGRFEKQLVQQVAPLVKERISTLKEYETLAKFFVAIPSVDKNMLGENYNDHLGKAIKVLAGIKKWDLENINGVLTQMIKENDFHTGKFFMDFRIAITGNKATPPINESIEILGQKETLKRLKSVLSS